MNRLITENKDAIVELCKEHGVESLYLFGSATNESFSDESDVDFLVNFANVPLEIYAENFFAFSEKLENLLHRKVDLVAEKSIRNPFFIQELEKTNLHIYGKQRDKISSRYYSVH